MKKSAIVILSHHMSADGILGEETVARVELGARLFEENNHDFIVTSGWDYRDDSKHKIGDVVAEMLTDRYSIMKDQVLVDVNARDTVGDAYFLRHNIVLPFHIDSLTVVTSSYHVERTNLIFRRFFLPDVEITTIGTKLDICNHAELLLHEENSSRAFADTFYDVDFTRDSEVRRALTEKHPFYNGSVHTKFNNFDDE